MDTLQTISRSLRESEQPEASHTDSRTSTDPRYTPPDGERQSGKTTKGNRWLRVTLVQAAWAASHTKQTYLAAQYHRLAGRRGKKRALVAVAHTILGVIYHLLHNGTTYHDLGPDYLDQLNARRLQHNLVKRLEKLAHKVTLEPAA